MGKGYRFQRRVGFRQTKKLFLIASEGAKTEPRYFEELKSRIAGKDAIIRVKLVSNPNHKSNPKHVLQRLSQAASKEGIKSGDELWLVIDRDAWSEVDLDEVCAVARKKGFFVALSNPCFELWLFLHIHNNQPFVDRDQCQRQLGIICESYSLKGKGGYDPRAMMPEIEKAIDRARVLDTQPNAPWPKNQATRVYLLVEKLLTHPATEANP